MEKNVIYIENLFSSFPYKMNNECSNKEEEEEEYIRVLEKSFSDIRFCNKGYQTVT